MSKKVGRLQYREDVSFFNTIYLGYLIIYFLGLCFVRVGHWVRQFFSFIYLFIKFFRLMQTNLTKKKDFGHFSF